MRGVLLGQCFGLLMRRELSSLSVYTFLVLLWQLAYMRHVNTQHSLLFFFFLLVLTSSTVQRTWVMCVLFSSPLISQSFSPFFFLFLNSKVGIFIFNSRSLLLPLLLYQYFWLCFLSLHQVILWPSLEGSCVNLLLPPFETSVFVAFCRWGRWSETEMI